MRLQTFRDDKRSRHFDLIGNGWSIDLVFVTAASILGAGLRRRHRGAAGPMRRPGEKIL
jgi:hypothetical protein